MKSIDDRDISFCDEKLKVGICQHEDFSWHGNLSRMKAFLRRLFSFGFDAFSLQTTSLDAS